MTWVEMARSQFMMQMWQVPNSANLEAQQEGIMYPLFSHPNCKLDHTDKAESSWNM